MVSKNQNNLIIVSFYRFFEIDEKSKKKKLLDKILGKKNIKGTILLANEGINGSLSGSEKEISKALRSLKRIFRIRKLHTKTNIIDFFPFNKMKVRLKTEIVSLGVGNLDVNKFTGEFVHPSKWNEMILNKNTKIIDVRNPYEIKIGKFSNALDPKTDNFRQFSKQFKKMKVGKNDQIAMYCTGGIRCEKASAYLKHEGYKKVFQLEGGILNYLDYSNKKKSVNKWKGECFVFDNRVTVKKDLKKGNYDQCYGCRSPITEKQKKSKYFKKGVSCPYCYKIRSEEQKKRSYSRQFQIDIKSLKY
tara:strand:+ start:800 stop:1708 length:909 start_codon:yes stop_codon:yes gene_type:complete